MDNLLSKDNVEEKIRSLRKPELDIARGIAILSIIAGHMGSTQISRFVFTFHVPLFFVISGLLYKERSGQIKKWINRLFVPYVFTVVVCFLLDELKNIMKCILSGEANGNAVAIFVKWIKAGLYGSGSRTDFLTFQCPSVGAVWFLLALFWTFLFLKILHIKTLSRPVQFAIVICFFGIGFVSAKYTWLPFSIQAGLVSFPFLFLGYRMKMRNVQIEKCSRKTLIMALIVWIAALFLSYTNGNMSLVKASFPNGIIDVLGAIAASFLILRFSFELSINPLTKKWGGYLAWYGQNSLAVLCVHLIELRFFPWRILESYINVNAIRLLLLFILKILLITLCVSGTSKIRFFKKLLQIKT